MMRLAKFLACAFAATLMYVSPAHAQATRTWVSGVGDDANPCSRTAPCKTFAGAISKTAAGGEINCLDPGGFGGVTITKAISIICDYTEGGVLVAGAGVNGIVINAPATSTVFLSGLDIFGADSAQNGIRFIAGAGLIVENSTIHSFRASNGLGISFQPSDRSTLTLNNVTIVNNGTASTGGGILIQPTGASGSARVTLNNVRLADNAGNNLRIDTTGNTFTAAGVTATINNSSITGGGIQGVTSNGISVNVPAATTTAVLHINNTMITNNSGTGISTNGVSATTRVANSTITGNVTGISPAGGSTIATAGNNQLIGNPTVGAPNNGTFNGSIPPA